MIDLKNVINNYPECLENPTKFKNYMLDLYPDNTNKARIRILADMVDCGIAAEIKNGKTDNLAVVNYCKTMENQYGYSEKLVKECVDLFIVAFGFAANILSDSIQAEKVVDQTECERKQSHKQITHKNNDVNYICNLDDFEISNGQLNKYKGHDQFVAIPNNVTRIGIGAFEGCKSLTNINISDGVTEIGSDAFSGCTNLTNITMPDSVIIICSFAFWGCTSLSSITISHSVTRIYCSAFRECTNLSSITIHDSVRYIECKAFYDTAYYNDSANWEKGVLYIGNLLIEVKSSYSGSCIIKNGTKTIAEDAFIGCTRLTSVIIPDSVASIGRRAFNKCTSLKSVTIPDSVTEIGDFAFWECTSLTSITIPDRMTSIGYSVFVGCHKLDTVYFYSEEQKNKFASCFESNVKLIVQNPTDK